VKLSVVLFSLCLLTGCSSPDTNDSVPIDVWHHKVKYAGTWHNNSTMYDSEDLELADNGTFSYKYEGCTQHRYSKGQWASQDNSIILISDSAYKPKEGTQTTSFGGSVYFNHMRVAIIGDTAVKNDIFINKRLLRR
jgi:hypothetical protein